MNPKLIVISQCFQIIVDYVNQQPVIRERLQAFLFGCIQDFWFGQITAANISVFGLEFLKIT